MFATMFFADARKGLFAQNIFNLNSIKFDEFSGLLADMVCYGNEFFFIYRIFSLLPDVKE
jgi:hypothetical protein